LSDWEYLELSLINNIKAGYWYWSDTKLWINVEDRLDEMGAVGWELVSTYTVIKTQAGQALQFDLLVFCEKLHLNSRVESCIVKMQIIAHYILGKRI
jgi:hypothetical protein